MEKENKNSNYILPASIIAAAVLISGSIIYLVGSSKNGTGGQAGNSGQNQASVSETVQKLGDRDVILGDANAPVTIIEYGDYQCTYCIRFFESTEPLIRDNYIKTGKVKMVFRGFQFLGPESTLAGQAAECAKDQNSFWNYHDAIYTAEAKDGQENNGNMTRDFFIGLAKNVGLDVAKFTSCYDSGKYADMVTKGTQDAAALGVNSTPTFFVNGQMVNGALPYSQFQTIIDNALKAASK
ncbi:MAG TPA: DsbA family protein [Candidatus Paceibacterota bacterium]|nr:DsbA family protein [Candidatus Paceibacterota bacterium]